MRTFSAGYYANLFKVLDLLKIETKIHRFRYCFLRSSSNSSSLGDSHEDTDNANNTSAAPEELTHYFTFFSNFHRILPCLALNAFGANILALLCSIWFTLAVFLLPPRAMGFNHKTETETLQDYARRIHLPDTFLDWYLLPLFASVSICSHADLRLCPAIYITEYRKRTLGAHHRTIADMAGFQESLTAETRPEFYCVVKSVEPMIDCQGRKKVRVRFRKFFLGLDDEGFKYDDLCPEYIDSEWIFDHVVIATGIVTAGKMCSGVAKVAEGLKEGKVRITVEKRAEEKNENAVSNPGSSEDLILMTCADLIRGTVTSALRHHPAGMDVTVSPCSELEAEVEDTEQKQQATNANDNKEVIHLVRPLPTVASHNLLLSVFGKNKSSAADDAAPWENGTDEIYLAGGYASAGLPLLEACVRSGLEAAEAIGAEIPFEIVRKTPF
ncbi:hypothetical protein BJX66DRAFT_311817 [Aspergillus keveii]|uniref:FAD/NAD(P)-binding domain-containing protein n=1 Tax=Aspergillus keveii TaxID=714993 RepID=A0ABR4FUX7_9EURO